MSENHRPANLEGKRGETLAPTLGPGCCVPTAGKRPTMTSLLDCILLKSSLGRSMASVDDICAKYLGTLFLQPEGGTLMGRWAGDQWVG